MHKFTPGPWTIERLPIESRGGSNMCFVIGPFRAVIYDDARTAANGITTEQNVANVQLLAASPAMLEALEKIKRRAWRDGFESPQELNSYLNEITEHASAGIKAAIGEEAVVDV